MDGECAFCGRTMLSGQPMFCDDCRAEHTVCHACAEDARGLDYLRPAA